MSKRRMLPARITAAWLKRMGACDEAVELFTTAFPAGVGRITVAHVRKARAVRLNMVWLGVKTDSINCWCSTCTPNETAVARDMRKWQRSPK